MPPTPNIKKTTSWPLMTMTRTHGQMRPLTTLLILCRELKPNNPIFLLNIIRFFCMLSYTFSWRVVDRGRGVLRAFPQVAQTEAFPPGPTESFWGGGRGWRLWTGRRGYTQLTELLHSYCTPTALLPHSYRTPTALRLHSDCTPTALRLHSDCTPTALRLHSDCTPQHHPSVS